MTSEPAGLRTSQQQPAVGGPGCYCSRCGSRHSDPALTRCPLCGGEVTVDANPAAIEDSTDVGLLLVFARVQCDACGKATALRRDHRCAVCGAALTGEAATTADPAVKARRQAFKGRLDRLAARAQEAGIADPAFTRKGVALPAADHLNVLRTAIDQSQALTNALRADLGGAEWDAREPDCLPSFHRVVADLDQGIDLVAGLLNRLPPVELRAAHRILTRALARRVSGYLAMTMTLTAPDAEAVLARKDEGLALFGEAAAIINRLSLLLDQIANQPADSAWMTGDVLDFATVAWSGVGNKPTTVAAAADVVRTALSIIPGIAQLEDAHALQLLPAIALGLCVADPTLLAERAVLMRSVLDDADRRAPGWIRDAAELVRRVSAGVRSVIELAERVGFASLGTQSRRMMIQLLIDVYGSLVEGPLRDLGGGFVLAARARRGDANAWYEPATARGIQAGDVVQELERIGGPWAHAVDMLLRNAGAHGGARVTDIGVEMTQRTIEGGILVHEKTFELTDAEFVEEFACLQESVLALQLGTLPWLMTHSDERVADAVALAQPTEREREALIRLLAGLGGLLEVGFEHTDNALTLRGRLIDPAVADDPGKVPSLLPAIFSAWPQLDQITIALTSKAPVTFARSELPKSGPGEDLPAVGLITRKWLGDRPSAAALRADLVYLVRPQLAAVTAAFTKALPPASDMAGAESDLRALAARLDSVVLPRPATGLVAEARHLIRESARDLARFRLAMASSDVLLRRNRAAALAGLADRVADVDRRATQKLVELTAIGATK